MSQDPVIDKTPQLAEHVLDGTTTLSSGAKVLESAQTALVTHQIITVVTDWRLSFVGGRCFGVCFVNVPPPHAELSFRRGFPLTDPGHVRCAVFGLTLGLEIVLSEIVDRGVKAHIALVTRSKAVYELFQGKDAKRTRNWATSTG